MDLYNEARRDRLRGVDRCSQPSRKSVSAEVEGGGDMSQGEPHPRQPFRSTRQFAPMPGVKSGTTSAA